VGWSFETNIDKEIQAMWEVQGLGMLRLKIGDDLRLHIWNPALEFPNVSKIHNHSWDLSSTVICGLIRNEVFVETNDGVGWFWKRDLVCGVGGRWKNEAALVRLKTKRIEVIEPGQTYSQTANEIHLTEAAPGTMTIMKRKYDGPNGVASIYWPMGDVWGTAEPRAATVEEVVSITALAALLMK
jgi:hypothetical protein